MRPSAERRMLSCPNSGAYPSSNTIAVTLIAGSPDTAAAAAARTSSAVAAATAPAAMLLYSSPPAGRPPPIQSRGVAIDAAGRGRAIILIQIEIRGASDASPPSPRREINKLNYSGRSTADRLPYFEVVIESSR